ncbi:hypothetical protein JEQ12_015913 [Ovis aries]|uniref:AIG1-type G domain-containing protein n=1 Tax=Ovis aries TaxID=9940 RepID=A0A836AAV3_SHEEP|nr:hypothetical protein JEQ12_015913 [Ovis aries]
MELIDKMEQNNQGGYFSDPIYKDIDQKLRQQEQHLKKVYADELQNKIKLVEKEYAHNPEEKEKQIKLLKQKHDERMKNIRGEAEMNIFQVTFNMIKTMLSKICSRQSCDCPQSGLLSKSESTVRITPRRGGEGDLGQAKGEGDEAELKAVTVISILCTSIGGMTQAPRAIQELICKFRDRYCVFNNKATGAEQEDQREQLLTLVQDVVNKCNGRYYTNSLYQKTEEEIQKQTQVLQENYRAELERVKAQIKQEFEEEIRKLKDELEQQKRKVEMEMQLAEREAYWVSRQQTAREDILSQNKILEIIYTLSQVASFVFSLFKH